MRINRINIDVIKIIAFATTIVLAAQGIISWWIALLFFLYGCELKISWSV